MVGYIGWRGYRTYAYYCGLRYKSESSSGDLQYAVLQTRPQWVRRNTHPSAFGIEIGSWMTALLEYFGVDILLCNPYHNYCTQSVCSPLSVSTSRHAPNVLPSVKANLTPF